jgi:hypothetical protein
MRLVYHCHYIEMQRLRHFQTYFSLAKYCFLILGALSCKDICPGSISIFHDIYVFICNVHILLEGISAEKILLIHFFSNTEEISEKCFVAQSKASYTSNEDNKHRSIFGDTRKHRN